MKRLLFLLLLAIGTAVNGQNSTIIHENNQFAFKLFEKLSSSNKNLVICPFSISLSMAMLYSGASPGAKEEIRNAFAFDSNEVRFHKNYKSLFEKFDKTFRGIQVNRNNSLLKPPHLNLTQDFTENIKNYYAADIKNDQEDFFRYLKIQSNNTISNIESSTDSTQPLLIANSLYFYANWSKEFDRSETKLSKFYRNSKDYVEVDYMNLNGEFNYFQNEKLKTIEIPYVNYGASMVIILPNNQEDITLYDYQLSLSQSEASTISLSIPRFHYQFQLSLKDLLEKSGMTKSFSDSTAFPGISKDGKLKITDFLHQVTVEINEKGTEAAAISTLKISPNQSESKLTSFKVERPFYYIIKENTNNSILFIGQIVNPAE